MDLFVINILEMCGVVSYKRGDYFYRTNKVAIQEYHPEWCRATVTGEEEFQVKIVTDAAGNLRTECTCPKLASFKKDCQHIAAVLLAIYEHQRQEKWTISHSASRDLSEGLLNLFSEQPVRSSGQQLYFENRQILDVEFICKPVALADGRTLFEIALKLGQDKVQNICLFLEQVREGTVSSLYDPSLHCFDRQTDAIIQELIRVALDEKVFGEADSKKDRRQILYIPPSSWERLLPLLQKAPRVNLEYEGQTFIGLTLTDQPLPLQFHFHITENGSCQLEVSGFDRILILDHYRTVIFEGKLNLLEVQACKRLIELKQMLSVSGTNSIPISQEQVSFFLEKVVPELKKLGKVTVAEALMKKILKKPLVAKLYLDRVKNLLLAGLEFHYEHVIIHPLVNREPPEGVMVFRDIEKEEEILQLMEESSFAKTDGGYYLQNEELEYEFLVNTVPKLQKLAHVYATTSVRNRIVRDPIKPRLRVKVQKERFNWLEFKFEIEGISDQQIRDVLAALEEKRKYYRLPNGSLLSLQTKEFEEIQRFLQAPNVQKKDIAAGLDLPIEQCLELLDSVEISDTFELEESFRQFLDTLHNPGRIEFEVPEGLKSVLKDYQRFGFKWMKTLAYYGFGGILADEMGLGKTVQSIAFIVSVLSEIRKEKLPCLIVCPSSLSYNWLSEIEKFAPDLKVVVLDGTKDERSKLLKEFVDMDILITSYTLLRRDITWFSAQSFHTVFFDEAQAFKNPLTQTARAVKKLTARHRFALTGTPIENSLEELWSIFHVVFPELFRGLKEFSKLPHENIVRRIRPFLLRRVKEDVLSELPEKIDSLELVELLPEQKKLYAAYLAKLRHDTLKHLDKDTIRKNRIKILAGLTRLRQICCHPGLFVDGYKGKSAKFDHLMRIIEESKQSGRRLLIFSQFTKMLEFIGIALTRKGMSFFYLNGQTPAEERVEICERFNRGERDLFLISLKAGGTGLNLMGADTVILYDTWWNPAVEEQAAGRAHRMGQKNTVQVIKLVARGTIEEKMMELQDRKRHLVEEVIDSHERAMGALTEDDIREILMIL